MAVQRLHANEPPDDWVGEARATKTPGGDYLVMFSGGQAHYHQAKRVERDKANDMLAYRSSDGGRTWTGPTVAWEAPYSFHGFIPLIPRGSKTLYAFGTEPRPDTFDGEENTAIGFRSSDDDGRTWSSVTLIEPVNDPGFRGMSVMRMCETESGAWLVGSHEADWTVKPIKTRQYVLRTEDRGATWRVHPAPRPNGWRVPEFDRMDEGRPIALGGGRVLLMVRTPEGHLWELRSADDGQTWSAPRPTTLVHPDAPPMLFHLSDGKTLAAFHHNRHTGTHFHARDRSELWVSTSTDDGRTWSEPRFMLANAIEKASHRPDNALGYSVSYIDVFPDQGELHLFISHQFRRLLYVRFDERLLERLPTRAELRDEWLAQAIT
jgi:Neuraminidase (sialidase)